MATVGTLSGLDELRGRVRGGVLTPEDYEYDEARKVYNGSIDIRPAVIVRCSDAADVAAAIGYAREQGLEVAVRGGSHNPAGFALAEGGLVIDLTRQNWVRVDAETQLVQVGGGCTLADIDHATHAYGLVVPSGTFGTTGIGGLALGGGIGHFTRKFGLTVDHLVEADVVLADGSLVTTNENAHPDLFWAIRGGGGNFGVVTAFTFRAHPLATVIAGPLFWPVERAPDVMRAWADLMADPATSEDLTILFAYLTVPPVPLFPESLHGEKVCATICVWAGDPDGVDEAVAPLRALEPVLDGLGPMPVPVLNGLFDPLYPPGLVHYWRADFIDEFTDEAIAKYAEVGPTVPTPMSQIHLFSINGAAARVPSDETAWRNRDAQTASILFAVSTDPADEKLMREWVVSAWETLHPYSAKSGGGYVNFMMDEGQDRVRAAYGENYERLARIKAQYDPDNLFRRNQNIKPAS